MILSAVWKRAGSIRCACGNRFDKHSRIAVRGGLAGHAAIEYAKRLSGVVTNFRLVHAPCVAHPTFLPTESQP